MARKKGNWKDPYDDALDELGGLSIDEPIDEEAIYIDMDEISQQAENDSKFMLKDLSKVYGNEQFMADHPEYKKRLDLELESIRVLLKMRRSSERAHDILVKQIGAKPSNASMYKALKDLQKSLLDIQTKLDETVRTVNNLLKNYQLELPFENEQKEVGEELNMQDSGDHGASGLRYRGSRQFIIDMQNQKNEDIAKREQTQTAGEQFDLFEEDEDDEDKDDEL